MQERQVSVVIPSFNRPKALLSVVETYLSEPQCAEAIVVDDGSKTPLAEVFPQVEALAAKHGVEVRLIRHEERRGASAARNSGIAVAKSPYIMTTDDDIMLSPGFVSECLALHEDFDNAGYVAGRVVYLRVDESNAAARQRAKEDRKLYFSQSDLTICFWGHADHPVAVPFCPPTGLWKRAVFESGIQYDEGYGGNAYREESDPQVAAQLAGWQIIYQPDAFAFHLPPAEVYKTVGGQRRHGKLWYEYWAMRNNLRFLRKYNKFLRDRWQARPWRSAINFELTRVKRGVTKVMGMRKAA